MQTEKQTETTVWDKVKEKLTSRKFWAAILAAILAVTVTLFGDTLTEGDVSALRSGITALVAYIFGEGAVDITRALKEK